MTLKGVLRHALSTVEMISPTDRPRRLSSLTISVSLGSKLPSMASMQRTWSERREEA